MTITQLLLDLSVLAGVLLMTALAVVPLWLQHEAERVERAAAQPRRTRPAAPADGSRPSVAPAGARLAAFPAARTLPRAA